MPDSPFSFHSGLGVIAVISVLGVVASLSTIVVSIFILWRYRRTVARLMSVAAGTVSTAEPAPDAADAARADTAPDSRTAEQLHREMTGALGRGAGCYAAAGSVFALSVGFCIYLAFSQIQINPLRAASHPLLFLFWVWTAAWPIVLTNAMVASGGARRLALIVLGYFVVLAALSGLLAVTPTEPAIQMGHITLPAWSGETLFRLAAKWSVFNLLPTVLFLVFRHRRVRAVAPLVLGYMTVVAAGVMGIMVAAYVYREAALAALSRASGAEEFAVFFAYFFVAFGAACMLFGALGWLLLAWLRAAYLNKTVSDQSLAVDALWLIFAAYYAAILAFAGPGWALAALFAFVLFRVTAGAAQRLSHANQGEGRRAPALLVLRVFSLGKRSELLFDAVTRRWRHIGNVQMIAGADLAHSTVAPHRLLAFVGGKLDRVFIRNGATLEHALAELDTRRDADGRFRINDFFCHADNWQQVLSRLIRRADVVLMDLRNFRENNAGCIFEIKALLDSVAAARLVFVVDATTDQAFLTQTLAQAWRTLAADSPNAALLPDALQPVRIRSAGEREAGRLLLQLCASVPRTA